MFFFTGILLPELIVSLILLEQELKMFLTSMNWYKTFDEMLKSLDRLCRLNTNIENYDLDDISWPGIQQINSINIQHNKYHDELPLIRKADLENHNLDGGLWLVINNRVYDVQDFRCDNIALTELLQKYAGKDASHIFNSSAQNQSMLQLMENYVVGNYCQNEFELTTPLDFDSIYVCSMLLDTERYLGTRKLVQNQKCVLE